MIAQLSGPGEFWSRESLDALQEWLILIGLGLGVILAIFALFTYIRKIFRKDKEE